MAEETYNRKYVSKLNVLKIELLLMPLDNRCVNYMLQLPVSQELLFPILTNISFKPSSSCKKICSSIDGFL